jgi:hypothetical protein
MALTEPQIISVAQILNVTPYMVSDQIALLNSSTPERFTAAVETAVEAQITLWDAGAGTKTTKIHPNVANKGVETNPTQTRMDIQQRIAVLLERPDWAQGAGSMEFSISR